MECAEPLALHPSLSWPHSLDVGLSGDCSQWQPVLPSCAPLPCIQFTFHYAVPMKFMHKISI